MIHPELDQLAPDDPSQCSLQDGRKIILRQRDLDDAAAYGMCGGDTTGIFSLWVGGKKVYNREPWHPKCGVPSEITEILVDGGHLTECRAAHQDLSGADAQPAACVDQSVRLSRPIEDSADDGKLVLTRFAPGRESFCRGLIKPSPEIGAPFPWPPRSQSETEKVDDSSEGDVVNLDNAGRGSQAVFWEGWWGGPNGDESVWAVLPETATKSDVEALQNELAYASETKINALRSSGINVFAGDQTSYRSVWHVHLTPFVRDATTWMHAFLTAPDPTDLILRPNAKGELEEICAFQSNPPL